MDWDEHVMLISHTVNLFSNHVLVIGNTGSNSTKEALHATEQGFAVGMHASLQINPYYGKTSMPGARSAPPSLLGMPHYIDLLFNQLLLRLPCYAVLLHRRVLKLL